MIKGETTKVVSPCFHYAQQTVQAVKAGVLADDKSRSGKATPTFCKE